MRFTFVFCAWAWGCFYLWATASTNNDLVFLFAVPGTLWVLIEALRLCRKEGRWSRNPDS